MDDLLTLISRHGYSLLALIVFLEAAGLPLPAALALLTAGAVSAYGKLNPLLAFGISVISIMLGDSVLFLVGRSTGWALLGLLCRLSVNPESCILRSAESFYRRGKITLVFAKFIPGINTMAPPLAGTMKMRPEQFLRLDLVASCLYVTVYGGIGFAFSDFLRTITHNIRSAGHAAELILAVGIAGYVVYRIWLYRKYRLYKVVPRIRVEELTRRLTAKDADKILLVDVRSHGYYDADASRIQGSVRIEPNNLAEEIKRLPRDKEIYLYCT
ncbi:MAG TPA: VTT domain-containing protein [Terriglobales bacterium]|nr:VTT domain-containing protein [Terriglobales bacterium]